MGEGWIWELWARWVREITGQFSAPQASSSHGVFEGAVTRSWRPGSSTNLATRAWPLAFQTLAMVFLHCSTSRLEWMNDVKFPLRIQTR